MGAPAEIIQDIFTVIEGGKTIGDAAQIIQFPSDAGNKLYPAVNVSFKSTNGTGLNYWVAAVAQGAAAISAGAIMVAVTIPEFMALAVPCLGIAVGTAWYNLDPDGWNNLADLLVAGGYTIKNKVVAFMNENGSIGFIPEEVEILKDELLRLGAFDHGAQYPGYAPAPVGGIKVESNIPAKDMVNWALSKIGFTLEITAEAKAQLATILLECNGYTSLVAFHPPEEIYMQPSYEYFMQLDPPKEYVYSSRESGSCTLRMGAKLGLSGAMEIISFSLLRNGALSQFTTYFVGSEYDGYYYNASSVNGTVINNENLQDFAKYPEPGKSIPETYPTWIPWEFPDIPGWSIPEILPTQYPDLLPEIEPYQEPAQNPDADPDAEAEKATDVLEDPNKNPADEREPEPEPEPDPEPQPEPDPIPSEETETPTDPIEPDPDIPPSPIVPVPPLPDTIHSNKLFTVYNPTASQLGDLGGYLWDNDLIDILRKIWQNPLDGIISLIQVYATPTTGGNSNIILGYLDSGVSSKVVSNQFVTIDCGTITVEELNENCLDYIPYTKMELYLPFIGITEIDTNEFMSGQINVKYKVDVYTGTCLAEVKCIRNRDLRNGAILYTFNGNCSQQIPLTSGDARGLFGTLVGAAGLALGIASGGATVMTAAGALGAASKVAGAVESTSSREMLHVGHSGNLSANAGIMGQKKPYLIINRERPYNANSYNKYYGFPANKTVRPGNYSGFLRLRAGRLRSAATEAEKNEIYEWIMKGVIM